MNILSALSSIFPPNRLKTSLVEIIAYAGDAGFYQLIPKAVVQPVNEAEIAHLFRICKNFNSPLVFRAAGTSLSGQSITDGILVDIGKHWLNAEVIKGGDYVKVQPGIIGANVNMLLKKYGKKIGPDPASINAAMMGGILSNNASGMCCGVANNSYHTLKSIRFMLPNGLVYDTSIPTDYELFESREPFLFNNLTQWRNHILADEALYSKIRRKYRMKNTVGYGLNGLVDYEHPLDMLAHLMIGAEGTLGFIINATLQTLPDLPCKAAAMLYFPGISEASKAIEILKESGAEALELMDRNALKSVEHLPGLPSFFKDIPAGAAALLCEYQAADKGLVDALVKNALVICNNLSLLYPAEFTVEEKQRQFYWKIRKGMFPSVGAVRQRGSTVILEDIAFPISVLADAVIDLQHLFLEFGYPNAIIFGHAKEGNIHFVITQLLNSEEEIGRYDRFMRKVVSLVLEKYDGTLKAEHGTGRNMAPFVQAEWGGVAYGIMDSLKMAVDPDNLLNPGVIINKDPNAHIRHLKQMPQVEEEVDKCIECGFCEHHCPSRNVTLTPRQRIQVRRHLRQLSEKGNQNEYKKLLKEYQYAGLDTCATDGLCQVDCPVAINTGDLVKRLRNEQHGKLANEIALSVAKHFKLAENLVRGVIKMGVGFNRILGKNFMANLTNGMHKLMPGLPRWWNEMESPPGRVSTSPASPSFVYFSACIQRMMGNNAQNTGIQETMLRVCKKAGIEVLLPEDLPGHCCGQAFSSKGFFDAAILKQQQLVDALWKWTNKGQLPVICDFTSCTYTLLKASNGLNKEYREKFDALVIMDSIEFIYKYILPELTDIQQVEKVVLHPGCAVVKLQLNEFMLAIAAKCAKEVVVPSASGCCGMAGDRGFLFPELTESATFDELREAEVANGYYASAKTCEMALTHFSGKPYEHIVYLLEATKKSKSNQVFTG